MGNFRSFLSHASSRLPFDRPAWSGLTQGQPDLTPTSHLLPWSVSDALVWDAIDPQIAKILVSWGPLVGTGGSWWVCSVICISRCPPNVPFLRLLGSSLGMEHSHLRGDQLSDKSLCWPLLPLCSFHHCLFFWNHYSNKAFPCKLCLKL